MYKIEFIPPVDERFGRVQRIIKRSRIKMCFLLRRRSIKRFLRQFLWLVGGRFRLLKLIDFRVQQQEKLHSCTLCSSVPVWLGGWNDEINLIQQDYQGKMERERQQTGGVY